MGADATGLGAIVTAPSSETATKNLPSELSTFVGREEELARVGTLLSSTRLLTLTGAGGCGKTRLALRTAVKALEHHPDGVWWVDLGELTDGALLPAAVISALGMWEVPGWSVEESLVDHLRDRSVLVVLDNCEHLLDECAELARTLLSSCPSLRLLVTSRTAFGVAGEVTWRVPSLSLTTDAVTLFIERATQVRPTLTLREEESDVIRGICEDLDGIPLAIELAAARMRMMTPEQIARGLADRFHLLTGGGQTGMARHQTLAASMDWSYGLLGAREADLLGRLSVFSGGWTLEAAESVCSGEGIERAEVLDLLAALVDRSLVAVHEGAEEMRYGFLNSVREYAAARLGDSASASVRARHLGHYLGLAETAVPALLRAGCRDPVFQDVAAEIPNFRAALDYAARAEPEVAQRLAYALGVFWVLTGRYREGEAAYAQVVGEDARPVAARARALAGRANLACWAGAYLDGPGWAAEAVEAGQACRDAEAEAWGHISLGLLTGAFEPAAGEPELRRGIDLARECGHEWCLLQGLINLSIVLMFRDGVAEAQSVLDEAHTIASRSGYHWATAWIWIVRARFAKLQGRLDEATVMTQQMVAASDATGDPVTQTLSRVTLAAIATERGNFAVIDGLLSGPLAHAMETGAGVVRGFTNQYLGRAAIARGALAAARRHLGFAIDSDSTGVGYFLPEHLSLLATVERLEGNSDAAWEPAQQALEIAARLGSGWMAAFAERTLARLALAVGDAAAAERHAQSALGHLSPGDLRLGMPNALELLGAAVAALGNPEPAARLLGGAEAGRGALGIARYPPEPAYWAAVETTTRASLGDVGFEAAYRAGLALDLSAAVAYARRARGPRRRPSSGWESLTPAELAVIRHVVAGEPTLTIGERLFISPGTVKVHLSHIFTKLNISSRAQLAVEAVRRGVGP